MRWAALLAATLLAGCAAWRPAPRPLLEPVTLPDHWSESAGAAGPGPEAAGPASTGASVGPAGAIGTGGTGTGPSAGPASAAGRTAGRGASVSPDDAVPVGPASVGLPGRAAAGGGGLPAAGWWRRFQDAQLDGLIGRALAANPGLAASRAALLQARAVRDQAAAALGPALTGNASVQRDTAGGVVSGSGAGNLAGSWDPDWSGASHAAARASAATAEAAAWTLGDAQSALAAETAQDYIALRGAQLRLEIARANRANQNDTAQITAWRTQAGLLTALENEQARAAREQAAAQVPALEAQIAQLLHALAILCGAAPGTLGAALAAPAPVPDPGPALAPAIPAEVLRARPDVRAAELRVQAAAARLDQADAERKPSFRLQGSLGLRGFEPGGRGGSTLLRSLLGSLTGNAYDGGAAQAAVRAQSGALQEAQASYRAVLLQALGEVEDSLAAIAADRSRLQRLAVAAEAASNAALLARDRYASGLTDFQTVLETQRNLYGRQDDVAITRTALAADHVRLFRALGGGWSAAAAPTVQPSSSASPAARSPQASAAGRASPHAAPAVERPNPLSSAAPAAGLNDSLATAAPAARRVAAPGSGPGSAGAAPAARRPNPLSSAAPAAGVPQPLARAAPAGVRAPAVRNGLASPAATVGGGLPQPLASAAPVASVPDAASTGLPPASLRAEAHRTPVAAPAFSTLAAAAAAALPLP